ncbi:MAG: response regulator [Bdellovibrionota bacterium]
MKRFLENRGDARIAVVDPIDSSRNMILDVLKNLGYTDIATFVDHEQFLPYLEGKSCDWLISPLLIDKNINTLQMMKLFTLEPRLKNLHTSLMLDIDSELDYLNEAFELGLLSYHKKTFVMSDYDKELSDLVSMIDLYDGDTTLTSAEYIRSFLKERHFNRTRIAYEQNLLSMYPGEVRVLFSLAEALFLNSKEDEAEGTLQQIVLINKQLESRCRFLRKKYTGQDDPKEEYWGFKSNPFGIKSCLLIDSDTDNIFNMKQYLEKFGIKNIEAYEDGEQAWEAICTDKEPELILTEWSLPKLHASLLIQRIRSHGFMKVPIVVVSSLVAKRDLSLIEEIGADRILKKPFEHEEFLETIVWTVQQNRQPTEERSFVLKIGRLLTTNRIDESKRLIGECLRNSIISDAKKYYILAAYQYYLGDYKTSYQHAIKALKLGTDQLFILDLMGKCLLQLRQFEKAYICLEKANAICDLNIERLLNMSSAKVGMGDLTEAENLVAKAKQLDSENREVVIADAAISIESGKIDKSKGLLSKLHSGSKLVSHMNNRAVSLVKMGKLYDGIKLYKRTLDTLPEKWEDLKNAVSYNIALAYSKSGDLELALQALTNIDTSADNESELMKKIHSLQVRLKKAIQKGSKLEFSSNVDGDHKDNSDYSFINEDFQSISIGRGDIGSYRIFYPIDDVSEERKKSLSKMPKFKFSNVSNDEELLSNKVFVYK